MGGSVGVEEGGEERGVQAPSASFPTGSAAASAGGSSDAGVGAEGGAGGAAPAEGAPAPPSPSSTLPSTPRPMVSVSVLLERLRSDGSNCSEIALKSARCLATFFYQSSTAIDAAASEGAARVLVYMLHVHRATAYVSCKLLTVICLMLVRSAGGPKLCGFARRVAAAARPPNLPLSRHCTPPSPPTHPHPPPPPPRTMTRLWMTCTATMRWPL